MTLTTKKNDSNIHTQIVMVLALLAPKIDGQPDFHPDSKHLGLDGSQIVQ
jgi:hypothetical protein